MTNGTRLLHQLTKGEQESVTHAENEGVPAFVFEVSHRVDGVADEEGEQDPAKVFEGKL